MTEAEYSTLRKACADYLRIRRYFSQDFYNHGSRNLDLSSWAVWQYDDPERHEGIVLAFRRPESPCDRVHVPLKGLPVGTSVEIECLDAETQASADRDVLEVVLPERRSSAVIHYRTKVD